MINILNVFKKKETIKTLDLTQKIYDIFGEVAKGKYPNRENGEETVIFKELTLGQVIQDTVLLEGTEVKSIQEEEHLLRYKLYEKSKGEVTNFSEDEINFIKVLVSKRYLPIFSGQILRQLNK
jgi:hypothetical protein